jgi:hypothetical protein
MSSEQPKENEMTETDALLKLIEIGNQEFDKGEYQSAEDFFKEMEIDENFSTQQAKENDLPPKQG